MKQKSKGSNVIHSKNNIKEKKEELKKEKDEKKKNDKKIPKKGGIKIGTDEFEEKWGCPDCKQRNLIE